MELKHTPLNYVYKDKIMLATGNAVLGPSYSLLEWEIRR